MLVIFGPTATGKTDLAIRLARKFQGEIISADSRQVYKGLDIGTGKVSFESDVEKHRGYWIVNGIKTYGFDLVNPGKRFSVADFLKHTYATVIRINEAEKLPIVVGGSGFYVKALIDGLGSLGIPQNIKLRRRLSNLSASILYRKLLEINPERAKSMNLSDRANPRRLIRAIELSKSSQKPPTTHHPPPTTHHLLIGLTAPNNYLYSRADLWLQKRLEHGLIDEVRKLIKESVDPHWLDGLGLEYRWLTRYLLGETFYEVAIDRLKGDIHSLIRRQKTWFSKFKNIEIFDISQENWRRKLEKRVKA